MKKQFCLLFLISLLWVTSVLLVSAQEEADAPYLDPTLPVAERVEDLLGRMTLEEKIGQMTLVEKNSILVEDIGSMGIGGLLSGGGGSPVPNTPASWAAMIEAFQGYALQSRLGIPLIYGVDAVHGHGNLYGAVIFPHNIGLGAANNPELMEQIGRITAIETAATGIFWNYGPALSVARDVRWGRTYESLSEDPTLVGELATAYLIGLQGDDLTASDTVMGTPKHFVGDGGTTWGTPGRGDYSLDQGDTRVDEETLREVYLAPYLPAIEAGAQSIMISFSSWNGEKMHGQKYLITDVLRGELGFDGFIVSDWAGMDHIAPNDYAASMVTGINAGIDMNMVPYDYIRFIITLLAAVENEDVSMERIDDAVRNILTAKFNLGLFENPYADPDLLATVGSAAHREVARQAVSESLVLLKNENDLLPLAPDVETVFVAGELADDIGGLCGGWSIQWQGGMGDITIGTTILDGIMNSVDNPDTVHYDKNGNFDDVADIGIVVVGEEPYAEGEGDDNDLNLTGSQRRLIRKMREKVDTLIIILVSGRPMTITPELEEADAFVAAWLPGTEGQGVADVLFGYRPFSGKLSFTWPRDMDQIPFDYNNLDNADPLFSFGYGLETEANGRPLPEVDYAVLTGAEAGADPSAEIVLEPFTDIEQGISGVAPTGWFNYDSGVFLRSNDPAIDYTQLGHTFFRDLPLDMLLPELVNGLALEAVPEISETIETDRFNWDIYRFEIPPPSVAGQMASVAMAFAETDTGTIMIGLACRGDEVEALYETVFLPAITAFDLVDATASLDPVDVHQAAGFNVIETLTINDFESDLFATSDEYGSGIGVVPWGDTAGNVTLALVLAEGDLARPGQDGENSVLAVTYDIGSWGGFSHAFTDGAAWVSQNWSYYHALSFWLYGNQTGAVVQVEIFDNRASGSTSDSAERWYYRITDDYAGWQRFIIPFDEFQRRTDWQPASAPDDGFGLTEVHAYAFAMPSGVGEQLAYVDQVEIVTYEGGVNLVPVVANEPTVAPTSVPTATPHPPYPSGNDWELVWCDEFEGEAGEPPNPESWTCETGGWGWGNNEHQYYTDRPENASLDGEGNLVITAIEENLAGSDCWYGECEYTSARCITMDKVEFTYGKIEARIKVPYGQGIWPAFWMLGAGFPEIPWPNSGEIDIMEHIGREPQTIYGTIHGPDYAGANGIGGYSNFDENLSDDYHVFSIEWEPEVIRWYVDGEEFFSLTIDDINGRQWVYDHDFFLLLNVAVGGNWPEYPDETTEFPQTMTVDWVRWYQRQHIWAPRCYGT